MDLIRDGRPVTTYLRDIGWLSQSESATVRRFPGGVSGNVWRIDSERGSWVLKQPLERLATEEEWTSETRRLNVEVAALKQVGAWYPEAVPEVLYHDAVDHLCIMTAAPGDAISWKTQMMAGQFDPGTARSAGRLLSEIHRESKRHRALVRPKFDDLVFFEQLRIEPFHRFLIDRFAHLQGPISKLVSELMDDRSALVHGDFSPKNMLVRPNGDLILLDFEVAHWGNPVFDVAYCAGHLMLKGWAVGPREDALAGIESFFEAYAESTVRLLPHLGLMLLARLYGKSTVEYVGDPSLRASISEVAIGWIQDDDLDDPLTSMRAALG
jgi:aminoglycoside phosphotransferase (APT) family kinase protein